MRLLAWHFLPDDRRLRFGDPMPIDPGYVYTAHGKLRMCRWGMHASERAIDALAYAPGSMVCRVELSGEILRGEDKSVARHREVIWMADANRALHLWACDIAEETLRAHDIDDPRPWDAIRIKRLWADGQASDADLAAAWDAARAAAWDAARDAAWDAARAAARAAA